jgi:predicted 2-oxoglutarate/Fe(II)-dependent dioxygenase YbiX
VEDFVDLGVAVDPVPGRLVLFPSTMVHEVKPVVSGDRFTVVTWYHA